MMGTKKKTVEIDEETLAHLKSESARYYEMAPRFCDGERVIAWLDDPKRKQANSAFTDSFERQIAYRFERLQSLEKTAQMYEHLRKLNPRQFADLYQRNIAGEGTFDDLVKKAMGRHEA